MTTSPIRLIAFFLLLVLMVPVALAEDDPKAPAQGEAEPAEKAKADHAIPKEVSVKLVSNGQEPRKQLRYTPAADTKMEFATSITTEVKSQMGIMKIGPIKSTIRVAFGKTEKGTIPVSAEITHAELVSDGGNPMLQQMKGAIEATKGTKLTGAVSGRGLFKPAAKDPAAEPSAVAAAAAEGLVSQMVTLFLPLPDEAVGVGASWTVTAPIKVNRIVQRAVITAKIEKMEGGRVELSIKDVRTARDVSMEMMGQNVPIPSIDGKGSGKAVLDLALGGVISSSTKLETEMVMNMMGSEMKSTSDVTSTVAGKAPAATTKAAPAAAGAGK